MFVKRVHILIQQRLQNIGVFAYSDVQPEEIDIVVNKVISQEIEREFMPLMQNKLSFEQAQAVIDRYRVLLVNDLELPVVNNPNQAEAVLPANYLHLVSDKSLALVDCNTKIVEPGKLVIGQYYINKGTKTITHGGSSYPTGKYFKATGTSYNYTGTGTMLVLPLLSKFVNNRLHKSETLPVVNDNFLTKSKAKSPVSSIGGNKIFVQTSDFFVEKLYISYIRLPKQVNINYKVYTPGVPLIVGRTYEALATSLHNGVTIQAGSTFIAVSTTLASGTVRELYDGDLEFNDPMCYHIIDLAVRELAIDSEQSQQKIVNQAQQNV